MKQYFLISLVSIFLISCCSEIYAQQPYIGKATTLCDRTDNSSTVLGYACNGINRSCRAYLTFRAQSEFDTISAISSLFAVNSAELSQLNSVDQNATFRINQVVLVPVSCSCSGQYYRANVSYVVQKGDNFFTIANNTLQGLSTCQAIQAQNNISARMLSVGTRITVPLRCACPTKNQSDDGLKYLLSYTVTWGEYVSLVSSKFGVNMMKTLAANELSLEDSTIYPFTTLLVPLEDPPSSSQVLEQPSPPPPPSTVPPSIPPPSNSSSKTWVYVFVGVLGGLIFVFIVGTVYFCMRRHKREQKTEAVPTSESFESVEKPLTKQADEESVDFWGSISDIAQSLKIYAFDELKSATENFSPGCWIKGSVYRGTINGDFAAIKKMYGDVSKEINLLNKINHFNLIRLSGVCPSEGHWYLVYEYAANGPLSDWIHRKAKGRTLNWTQRVYIALDVATGLNYLHHFTSPSHVHKDLNSGNVLLDNDFRAKIANFGLARSTDGQEGNFVLTKHIVGTQGYMAPEYLEDGFVSPKLDVYAFGVLMLEILTGKEIAALYSEGKMQLQEVLIPLLDEEAGKENLEGFMDPLLGGKYPPDLAICAIRLISDCIKRDPSDRPNTDEIIQSLTRITTTTLSGEWSISISDYRSLPR